MNIANWIVWFAIAGTLVAVEIFIGTFYLLMLALGMIAGGLVALAGFDISVQLIVAAVVGSLATVLLRKSKYGSLKRSSAAHDPNVNLDIGKTVTVEEWESVANGVSRARVSYRGAWWDVELADGAEARPGLFIIREIRSNRLVVANTST